MNQLANTMHNTHANATRVAATTTTATGPRWHGRVDSAGLGATSALGIA